MASRDDEEDGRRLPRHLYDAMFQAYLINDDPKHVAEATGVSLNTVKKYIDRGDPRRGLPSLLSRLKDAKATTRAMNRDVVRNILQRRAEQKTALSDMMYTAMVDRDTATLINPAHATPRDYILMTKDELESNMAFQSYVTQDTEEQGGGETLRFEDPAVQARLRRKFAAVKQEAVIATLRHIVELLDPRGERGIRQELPSHLRRALEIDAEDVTDLTASPNG